MAGALDLIEVFQFVDDGFHEDSLPPHGRVKGIEGDGLPIFSDHPYSGGALSKLSGIQYAFRRLSPRGLDAR